jgi:hypothetical protein
MLGKEVFCNIERGACEDRNNRSHDHRANDVGMKNGTPWQWGFGQYNPSKQAKEKVVNGRGKDG